MWFALAVITGRLPLQDAVLKAVRMARLDGPLAALAEPLTIPAFPPMVPGRAWPKVRVISDRVIVDVHDTARTEVATGIQRVARQTAQRWDRDHDVTMIGWTADDFALRELNDYDKGRALGSIAAETDRPADTSGSDEIIVPWRCQYLLPELIAEPKRNHRLQSLLRFSGNRGASIGFDLVPLTSAETVAEGMGQGFSTGLAAATYMTRIATISNAAATEYLGWREMLAGTGLPGPDDRGHQPRNRGGQPVHRRTGRSPLAVAHQRVADGALRGQPRAPKESSGGRPRGRIVVARRYRVLAVAGRR